MQVPAALNIYDIPASLETTGDQAAANDNTHVHMTHGTHTTADLEKKYCRQYRCLQG
jgi:hypothetical protein